MINFEHIGKYGLIGTSLLIRTVQDTHSRVSGVDWQKKFTLKGRKQLIYELAEMRVELIERLATLDRTRADFFPKESRISYTPPFDGRRIQATVKDYSGERRLVIRTIPENLHIEVETKYCTLLFIRDTKL